MWNKMDRRHTAFEDLDVLCLFIILCLEITSKNEDRNWHPKLVVESNGLLSQLMEPKFFVAKVFCSILSLPLCFRVHLLISMLLQDSDMEICGAFEMITNVQAAFDIQKNSDNEFHTLYSKANSMAKRLGKLHLLNQEVKLFGCCSFLVSFCALFVRFCLLLVTFCLLLVTICSLLVTFWSLLVTFCSTRNSEGFFWSKIKQKSSPY